MVSHEMIRVRDKNKGTDERNEEKTSDTGRERTHLRV